MLGGKQHQHHQMEKKTKTKNDNNFINTIVNDAYRSFGGLVTKW